MPIGSNIGEATLNYWINFEAEWLLSRFSRALDINLFTRGEEPPRLHMRREKIPFSHLLDLRTNFHQFCSPEWLNRPPGWKPMTKLNKMQKQNSNRSTFPKTYPESKFSWIFWIKIIYSFATRSLWRRRLHWRCRRRRCIKKHTKIFKIRIILPRKATRYQLVIR